MPMTTFTSHLFGTLEVERDQLLTMPDGLLGFPGCTSLAMLPAGRDGFFWLHSVEEPSVAFLMVDPFLYFEDYSVDITGTVLQRLGANEPADVNVFAIVTLPGTDGVATANLQGPLVFSVASRQGFQAVLPDSPYGTRAQLLPPSLVAH